MKRRAMFHAANEKYCWKCVRHMAVSESEAEGHLYSREVEYAAMQFGMPCIPYPLSELPFLPYR